MTRGVMPHEPTPSAVGGSTSRRIRADFPALQQRVHGKPLVYLDSAATALKPQAVIDAVTHGSTRSDCANIHRAVHLLSASGRRIAYEGAREKARAFLNAPSERGDRLRPRHHRGASTWWPRRGRARGSRPATASLITRARAPQQHRPLADGLREDGRGACRWRRSPTRARSAMDALEARLDERVKIVAVGHVSNALGTVQPVEEIVRLAHAVGAKVLLDGAQAAPHRAGRRAAPSAATSTRSAATSSTGRRASACSGAGASCSTRRSPTRAAAT